MRSHIALAAILALAASSGLLAGPRASAAAPPANKRAHAAGPARGLDSGARASAVPVDRALAARGKGLFQSKTCATCHGFGSKVTCPDLAPVPGQRSAQWILSQIQHPDRMTATDPIAKALLKQYKVQMPVLGVSPGEARALLEYIKSKGK